MEQGSEPASKGVTHIEPMKCLHWILAIAVLAVAAGCASGPAAPSVNLYRLGQTKATKLEDLKGKVVLIDVWATWCGPCRETMPMIQELYTQYRSKGLEVVAVSAETAPTVEKFVKENPYTYPVYLDMDDSFRNKFPTPAIPWAFVIDRNGNIAYQGPTADHDKVKDAIVNALG